MPAERPTVEDLAQNIATESASLDNQNRNAATHSTVFTLDELLRMRQEFTSIQMRLYKAQELVETSTSKMDHILDLLAEAIESHPTNKPKSELDHGEACIQTDVFSDIEDELR